MLKPRTEWLQLRSNPYSQSGDLLALVFCVNWDGRWVGRRPQERRCAPTPAGAAVLPWWSSCTFISSRQAHGNPCAFPSHCGFGLLMPKSLPSAPSVLLASAELCLDCWPTKTICNTNAMINGWQTHQDWTVGQKQYCRSYETILQTLNSDESVWHGHSQPQRTFQNVLNTHKCMHAMHIHTKTKHIAVVNQCGFVLLVISNAFIFSEWDNIHPSPDPLIAWQTIFRKCFTSSVHKIRPQTLRYVFKLSAHQDLFIIWLKSSDVYSLVIKTSQKEKEKIGVQALVCLFDTLLLSIWASSGRTNWILFALQWCEVLMECFLISGPRSKSHRIK